MTRRPAPKRGKAKIQKRDSTQKQAPFPTRDEVLAFIRDSTGPVGKRDIARAFRLSAAQRVELKVLLRDMKDTGQVTPGGHRRVHAPGALPDVGVFVIDGTDDDGDVKLRPEEWQDESEPPTIYLKPLATDVQAPGEGARILAKLRPLEDGTFEASLMRVLDEAMPRMVGTFHMTRNGPRVESADRKAKGEVEIQPGHTKGAQQGDLVIVDVFAAPRFGPKYGRVREVLGQVDDPGAISLITIAAKNIPTEFPGAALAEAESATVPALGGRTDLRHLPLVTIDGEDARDFDDAVFAEPDTAADNLGGWRIVVAIADVSHYVKPDSALDREAYRRGNSVYFPDRVVPMLPEALSNGLCSLKPDEPRACMAFEMIVSASGDLKQRKLVRGLMQSVARLTYEQVQRARDGTPDGTTAPLMDRVITPLYGAYDVLLAARARRGTLELDLPERKVLIGPDGKVAEIVERERLDSHRLIEEFMILANVAAAEMAGTARAPTLYRVHDRPDPAKLDTLREFLKGLGFGLAKGQVVKPAHLTQLLKQAAATPQAHLISDVVLRAQATAIYSPDNIGHFGLALRNYAHFTSPIRRYADLVVHRTLIRLAHLGGDGIGDGEIARLSDIGEHISQTERRAAEAERDATGRYVAAYMADHIGELFEGRISGASRFGLFVRVNGTGAEGLIPIGTLPDDYYIHDEAKHALIGRRTGRTFRLADPITVKLREADGITGSTLFAVVDGEGRELSSRRGGSEEPSRRSGSNKTSPGGRGRREKRGG